jgi:hypothetical protein
MDFEWDPTKADANLAKHGVDFEDTISVFDDPVATIEIDPRNYVGEVRYWVTGSVEGVVVFVCYTVRGERCRIISARRANRREREAYSLQARDRSQTGGSN